MTLPKYQSLTLNIGSSNGSYIVGALHPSCSYEVVGGTDDTRGARIGLDHFSDTARATMVAGLAAMGMGAPSYCELAQVDSDSAKGGACGSRWSGAWAFNKNKEFKATVAHRGTLCGTVSEYSESLLQVPGASDGNPAFLFARFAVSATRLENWRGSDAPIGAVIRQTQEEKDVEKAERYILAAEELDQKANDYRVAAERLLTKYAERDEKGNAQFKAPKKKAKKAKKSA